MPRSSMTPRLRPARVALLGLALVLLAPLTPVVGQAGGFLLRTASAEPPPPPPPPVTPDPTQPVPTPRNPVATRSGPSRPLGPMQPLGRMPRTARPPIAQPVARPPQPRPPIAQPVARPPQPRPPIAQPVARPAQPRPPIAQPVARPPQPRPPIAQPVARPAQPQPPIAQPGPPILPAGEAPPDAVPPAPRDRNGPQPIIRRIEFVGTVVYSPASIKVLMRNKEGQRLDLVALDADSSTLFQYFKDVDIRQEEVPGGIILRIHVSENPLVVELKVRGNSGLEDAEISDLMRTRVGFPLNPYHLSEDVQDIVGMYRLRGYHFAHVPEPQITTLPNGGRRVDLAIVEGPEVKIERIVFRGNVALKEKVLREVMLTQEPVGIQKLIGTPTFREEALLEDIVALKGLYRDEGFLDVEVFLNDIRFSDDKSKAIISIVIEEHQPYQMGDLEIVIKPFEDNPAIGAQPADRAFFTEERIRSLIPIEPGGRFSGKLLKEGIEKIQAEYFKRSFLEANVSVPLQSGRENELVVDLQLEVREGPKLRIARIDFVGNEYTRDKILRREVQLSPGGYVDRSELERGETRLRRTNWFDRSTMRLGDALGPDGQPLEGWKSVVYEIVEGKTGNFNFGIGVSTNGGAFGTIQFTKHNFDIARPPRSFDEMFSRRAFTGAGQELEIFLQPSTVESAFRVRFREPRLFGTKLAFDVSLSQSFSFRDDYLVDRLGYSVGLGYPLFKNEDESRTIQATLRWRHEWIDLEEIDSDAIPGAFLFRDRNELRSISGNLRFRATDDIRKPKWRVSANLSAEFAGALFGGDLDFYKLGADLSHNLVLHEDEDGKKQRLVSRVTVGFSEALEDTPELPPYERYFGGGSSFRGFAFRGMGPHILGTPTGGQWAVLGSFEYEYPIVAKTVGVVVFADWGTVATSIHEADADKWRLSLGIGLRLVVPMLGSRPLAFDFGFPIFYEDEDQRSIVSFNLGRSF